MKKDEKLGRRTGGWGGMEDGADRQMGAPVPGTDTLSGMHSKREAHICQQVRSSDSLDPGKGIQE